MPQNLKNEIRDQIRDAFLEGLTSGGLLSLRVHSNFAHPEAEAILEKYGCIWRYIGLGPPMGVNTSDVLPLWLDDPLPMIESVQKQGMRMTLDLYLYTANNVGVITNVWPADGPPILAS